MEGLWCVLLFRYADRLLCWSLVVGQSKTANILFARHLNNLMKKEGVKVTAVSVHPGTLLSRPACAIRYRDAVGIQGVIMTNLGRSMGTEEKTNLFKSPSFRLKSTEQGIGGRHLPVHVLPDAGAATTIVAAIDPLFAVHETAGVYLADCNVAPVAKWADSDTEAAKLWDWTEKAIAEAK